MSTARSTVHVSAGAGERTNRAPSAPRAPDAHPGIPGRKHRSRAQWTAWAFLTPVALYLVLFYAYPIARNVLMGFQDYTAASFVTGVAPFIGFDNYVAVTSNPLFWPTVARTGVFVVVSLVFQFSLGLALAQFFNHRFRLSLLLRSLFLLPWLLPLIVSASTWKWMFDKDAGILNYFLSIFGIPAAGWTVDPALALLSVIIVNIWIGVPFNMVILYGGLQSISESVYEAASLDGAGPWTIFWKITFPLLRPVSAVVLLLGLVYTLKVFDVIWITTQGGPANSSHTLSTWSYQLSFGPQLQFGLGAAAGNILIVVALIFGFIYIRSQRKQEQL
jgi:multiple sugar transport system permease protein